MIPRRCNGFRGLRHCGDHRQVRFLLPASESRFSIVFGRFPGPRQSCISGQRHRPVHTRGSVFGICNCNGSREFGALNTTNPSPTPEPRQSLADPSPTPRWPSPALADPSPGEVMEPRGSLAGRCSSELANDGWGMELADWLASSGHSACCPHQVPIRK